MQHFQNLRLKQYKGLKAATMIELGKINVICGPNNSGKTTVLECIADPRLRNPGKSIDSTCIERVRELSMGDTKWTQHQFERAYPNVLAATASKREVWFEGDEHEFWASFIEGWQEKFPQANPGIQQKLERAFANVLNSAPQVVLIPAKRKLQVVRDIAAYEPIKADGSGILNFLFLAKNQSESSPIRQQFEKIRRVFYEITAGYEFEVFVQNRVVPPGSSAPSTKIELNFRRKDGSWIFADDCGIGLQEILITLYFSLASEFDIVLIEEPENHLHPEIQRRLVSSLRLKSEKQFFLSTHSSVFLNTQFADRVFTCRMTESVLVENVTSRAVALTELGYSIADNLVSDLVVLCEGPKDKLVLEEFFNKMNLCELGNIKVWPLGGDIMDQLDLSVFQESNQLIALIDGDPGSSVIRKRFMTKCEEINVPVTRLERYAMENYFSLSAIAVVMKGQMPGGLTELDPNKPVGEQLGFEVKRNGGKIAREMSLEDIKGTDFEAFLHQIADILKQG